jgi:hypothetical protein
MGSSDPPPPPSRVQTFDANARFVVLLDDEGYGVWRIEELGEGDPIERFPGSDEGYERASARWLELTRIDRRERGPWLSWLKWVVVGAAAVWVVAAGIAGVLLFEINTFSASGDGLFDQLFKWSQIVSGVAQPLTLGGLALYVVLWFEGRRVR